MVACFGLHDGCQLPRVPLDRLIECRARLDVVMLLRLGALTEGVETKLQVGKTPYRLATHTPNLLVDGNHVPVVWTDWALPWFECPRCRRRCRHIFLDELACRKCLRLDYASRHLRRQTPGVGRVERLRRKLGGCDTRPFASLPARPPGRSKAYHERLVTTIQAEEQALVEHLQSVTHDLERRIQVRRRKHQW